MATTQIPKKPKINIGKLKTLDAIKKAEAMLSEWQKKKNKVLADAKATKAGKERLRKKIQGI